MSLLHVMLRTGTAFALTLLSASPAYSYALKDLLGSRLDPSLEYRTLRTAHFDVHFPVHLEAVARVVAATAERSHDSLTEQWGGAHPGRTHIVVVHRSDQPDIFTFVTPMRQVFFDVALPHKAVGLNDFGQWHDWLLTHEYAHIVFLQRGPSKHRALKWLFGRWLRPNMTAPPWLQEGLAVWAETNLTNYGRGNSSSYRMMMRTAVNEGVLRDSSFAAMDTVSNYDNRSWPWTFRPYLFGYYLIRTLDRLRPARDGQPGALQRLPDSTARSGLYALDRGLRAVASVSFEALWQQTLVQIEEDARAELQALKAQGPLTPLRYLTDTGFLHFGVEISPDGKTVLVSRECPSEDNAILALTVDGDDVSTPRVLIERTTGYQSSFSASSRFVVFDQTFRAQRHYLVSDLYILDRKTSEIVSNSSGFRARDPDVHPDGQHIVFVGNAKGKNHLYITNTNWEDAVDLLGDVGYRRLSGPRFSPSGEVVVVSVHNETTGGEDLWLVSSDGLTVLVADGARNRDADFSPDGRWLLYSSDKTGVFNVYAYDLDEGRVFRVSHVLGGLFYPQLDPAGRFVYAVSYRARGYDLVRFRWDPATWIEVSTPPAPRAYDPRLDSVALPTTDIEAEDYSPWSELWPQTVVPSVLFRPDTYQVGASVSATDALFTNHYQLTLRYDRATELPIGGLSYFSGAHRYAVDLAVTHDAVPVGDDRLRLLTSELAVHLPLDEQGTHYYLRPSLWVQWVEFRGNSLFPGVSLSAEYDTEFRQLGQTFPESSELLRLGVRQTFATRTDDVYSTALFATARTHLPLGWARHVVHMSLSCGVFVAGREDPNALFYAGGQLSFPFSLASPYLIYGYRPNALVGPALSVATVHYTLPIYDFQRGLSAPPLALGRLSAGLRGQAAFVDGLTPAIDGDSGFPWSAGVELYQELVVGHLFGLRAQLGLYRGDARWGGRTEVIFSLGASE